ncbi:hypothetical protein BDZ85DRAFT_255544 [Elsinoe ampelina]|uniref:Uncharacterized protein n=1 Tax=Elsinoe ampelina TaxID=302913 RepID=A0A6A6GRF5_9PEZI|nr:hypothetical protein BDZ85DRAFT_255544 [Elsinoe ampelina]
MVKGSWGGRSNWREGSFKCPCRLRQGHSCTRNCAGRETAPGKKGLAVVVILSSDTGGIEESYGTRLRPNDAVAFILGCSSCVFGGWSQ